MLSFFVESRRLLLLTVLALAVLPQASWGQEHAAPPAHDAAVHLEAGHGEAAHGDEHHGEYTIWSDLPFWSAIAFIGFVLAIKALGLWDYLLSSMSERERAEAEGFERLKAELTAAFAAPESAYQSLDAETIIARNARN